MPIGQFREEWRVRRGISQLSVGGGVARQSYLQKIIAMFGTSLIGYWPGSEEAGTVAVDYSGNGYNGVYTGVTLGQEGIGDGLPCPLYDGVGDYTALPAGFRSALNVSEGTIGLWAKVSGAGVWTDATTRNLFFLSTDATNRILLRRSTTNNQLSHAYVAGGTTESVTFTTSTIDWFHTAITWSVSADEVKVYFNGIQQGATQTTLGTWAGAVGVANIGGEIVARIWDGYLAHCISLNRAATPAEVATAAVI